MDKAIKTKGEKLRVGTKIIRQLSTTFYGKARMIFDELVTNSHDALATKVNIEIAPERIIVEDNGEGMTRDQLVRFFYISHTDRIPGEMKTLRGRKRRIIAKFGIGKLSMYQICKKFDITSWRDGIESHAIFDFDAIEKKDFIDEIELEVDSSKTDRKDSGTRIVLTELKSIIDPEQIIKGLSMTMPLKPDFEVRVNGIKLEPVPLVGHVRKVKKFVPDVGEVTGKIIYTRDPMPSHEAGVYIRVFGRIVNNDPRILDFSSLSGARSLSRRIFGDLEVDGLDEAVLSNRSSFISDHPKYVNFLKWLETTLNRFNREEIEIFSARKRARDNEIITREIAPALRESLEVLGMARKSRGLPGRKPQKGPKLGIVESEKSFVLHGKPIHMRIDAIGESSPEVLIDKKGDLVINSDHPLYKLSEEFKCEDFHSLKATLVAVAIEMSRSIEQFKRNYNKLASTVAAR